MKTIVDIVAEVANDNFTSKKAHDLVVMQRYIEEYLNHKDLSDKQYISNNLTGELFSSFNIELK